MFYLRCWKGWDSGLRKNTSNPCKKVPFVSDDKTGSRCQREIVWKKILRHNSTHLRPRESVLAQKIPKDENIFKREYRGIIQITWEEARIGTDRIKTLKYYEEKILRHNSTDLRARKCFLQNIFKKNTEAWFNWPERKSVLAQAWNELIPAGKKLRTVFFLNTNI